MGKWKISKRTEKWENGKDLIFPFVCLVGGVEKCEGEKLFCLVGEKKWEDKKCSSYKLTILSLLYNI